MLKIVCPLGVVFAGESKKDAEERERKIAEHNEMVEREWNAWKPGPMEGYKPWLRKHAPWMLDE